MTTVLNGRLEWSKTERSHFLDFFNNFSGKYMPELGKQEAKRYRIKNQLYK